MSQADNNDQKGNSNIPKPPHPNGRLQHGTYEDGHHKIGKRELHIGHTHKKRIQLASEISGYKPDDDAQKRLQEYGEHADGNGDAHAIDHGG